MAGGKKHRLDLSCYIGSTACAFTLCIFERKKPFQDSSVVGSIAFELERMSVKNHAKVLLWVFMPDHLHCILQGCHDKSNLWKAIGDFKQVTGYWFSRNLPWVKWQRNFYDHVPRSEEDLMKQANYILQNPVRSNIVSAWEEYPLLGGDLWKTILGTGEKDSKRW